MSFFSGFFSKPEEKLTSFQVTKTPSFEEFKKILKDDGISDETIEDLFEKMTLMPLDSFLEKYPSKDSSKCQHIPTKPEWFYSCKNCCNEANYYCRPCFFDGKHIEKGHSFTMLENSIGRVCDCGGEGIKTEGYCTKHTKSNEKIKRELMNKIPSFVKKDVHIFFRYLLQYLQSISTLPPNKTISEELKEETILIGGWFIMISSISSSLVHMAAEEIASRVLDSPETGEFKLSEHKSLPYKIDLHTMSGSSGSDIQPFTSKGSNLLSFLFSNINSLHVLLPLVIIFYDNHQNFKLVVIEEFLKNYTNLFKTRDSISTDISIKMSTLYCGNNLISKFCTDYSKHNYLELVLRAHKNYYVPLLLPFYQTSNPEDIKKEVMLQTDLENFPKLMKVLHVAKYFAADEEKLDLFFELAGSYHQFTTLEYIDPSISTCKFLLNTEHYLVNTIRAVLTTLTEDKESKKLLESTIDIMAEKLVAKIMKLKKRKMTDRCGMMLEHADFFENFTYAEIPVHFPLFRILSAFLILSGMDPMDLKTKYYLTDVDVTEMVTTILLFRFCYVTYDVTTSTENITDISLMYDLHLLQVGLCLLGTKKFLLVFFNTLSSISHGNNSKVFVDNLSLLISTFQARATLSPNKTQVFYHLYQGAMSGLFFKVHFRSFDMILAGLTETDICEKYLDEFTTPGESEKQLLDPTNWKYYDRYYPYFSLNYRDLIGSNCLKKYKLYKESLGLPSNLNPLPPQLEQLPSQLSGVYSALNDQYLFQVIFIVLVAPLYPTFIGYENSIELQPVIKRLFSSVPNPPIVEFFYILTLSFKSFKEQFLSGLQDSEKLELQQSLQEYFKLDVQGKYTFKFQSTIKENAITHLLQVYNVDLGETNGKVMLSLLDLLLKFKDKISSHVHHTSSIDYVFDILYEFDSEIFKQFKTSISPVVVENTTTTPSPNVEDSLKELTIKDGDDEAKKDEVKVDVKVDVKVEEEEKETTTTEVPTKNCVICEKGEETGRLHSMAYIDLSSVVFQNSSQNSFYYAKDTKSDYDPRYQEFIETFFLTDIKPGSVQFVPYKDDPAAFFACYLFQRCPSTYISSCGHNVHKKCLDMYNRVNPPPANSLFNNTYKCAKVGCGRECDILIPLGKPDQSIDYKSSTNELFSTMCYFDFLALMEKENRYSIDKYLWKFVLQNIETLELKSRLTTLYNESEDDPEYYLMSEEEFQNELLTTSRLFNVVMTADVEPEPVLPIYDESTFFIDPFTSSSYSVFLAPTEHPVELLFKGLASYLFNVFLHYCIKEDIVPRESVDNPIIASKLILEEYNDLFFDDKGELKELDDELYLEFENQIHPYLRKLLIFNNLYKSESLKSPTTFDISLDLLSNFGECLKLLVKCDSLEVLFTKFVSKDYLELSLGFFMKKKKVSANISHIPQLYCTYPPPQQYDTLPQFFEMETSFATALEENTLAGNCVTCKKVSKMICLVCGAGICPTSTCKSGPITHLYSCESAPIGYYQQVSSPSLYVYLTKHSVFTRSFSTSVYLDKDGKKPFDLSDCNLTLSKNELKKLYINWMNHTNSEFLLKNKNK
ncbi:hypothetical protein RB653_008245 [Dictyostelium firmibasis]|uniref:E3 ubiquitin-protein ligase n=1 Tax=Dictyostelium firmibasis TaxID=79012 RepID=A0AAN7TZS5_9MYCE